MCGEREKMDTHRITAASGIHTTAFSPLSYHRGFREGEVTNDKGMGLLLKRTLPVMCLLSGRIRRIALERIQTSFQQSRKSHTRRKKL